MIHVINATSKIHLVLSIASICVITTFILQTLLLFYRWPSEQSSRTILQIPRDNSDSETLLRSGTPFRKQSITHTQAELDAHTGQPYFLQAGESEVLVHYDSRYYLGSPVSDEDRRNTLHHLIRAYVTFFRDHNLQSWIAHGTLLGFWWNAQILPWDMDIDVQVPEAVLFRLGKQYNMTAYGYQEVENSNSNTEVRQRHYILDVNPNIFEREKGWGDNVIDARFIDISNGLYIDITGISQFRADEADAHVGIWKCKNNHRYDEDNIWPLRETLFEGIVTTVPNRYEAILIREYGSRALSSTKYHGHEWSTAERGWIKSSRSLEV